MTAMSECYYCSQTTCDCNPVECDGCGRIAIEWDLIRGSYLCGDCLEEYYCPNCGIEKDCNAYLCEECNLQCRLGQYLYLRFADGSYYGPVGYIAPNENDTIIDSIIEKYKENEGDTPHKVGIYAYHNDILYDGCKNVDMKYVTSFEVTEEDVEWYHGE